MIDHSELTHDYPRYPKVSDIDLSETEKQMLMVSTLAQGRRNQGGKGG